MGKSQEMQVLEYLQRFGSITPLEALNAYGIMRLSARIWRLRHAGHCIGMELIPVKNRVGEEVKVARYYLVNKEGNKNG